MQLKAYENYPLSWCWSYHEDFKIMKWLICIYMYTNTYMQTQFNKLIKRHGYWQQPTLPRRYLTKMSCISWNKHHALCWKTQWTTTIWNSPPKVSPPQASSLWPTVPHISWGYLSLAAEVLWSLLKYSHSFLYTFIWYHALILHLI